MQYDALTSTANFSNCSKFVRFGRKELSEGGYFVNHSVIKQELAEASSCKLMVHIRHPFDTLVSMYNSFTTDNHPYRNKKGTPKYIEEKNRRQSLHNLGTDGYALKLYNSVFTRQSKHLESAIMATGYGCEVWLSRYEDMVIYPKSWMSMFLDFLGLRKSSISQSWIQNQLLLTPNETSHTAYITPGTHRAIFKQQTIMYLIGNLTDKQLTSSGYF